jgi:hypothetical protein
MVDFPNRAERTYTQPHLRPRTLSFTLTSTPPSPNLIRVLSLHIYSRAAWSAPLSSFPSPHLALPLPLEPPLYISFNMAIHPSFPGLEVTIVVNGNQSKEYDDGSDPGPNTTKRYIESTTGASFHFKFDFRKPFSTTRQVAAKIFIDGQYSAGQVVLGQQMISQNRTQSDILGSRTYINSQPATREFTFSSLESAESGSETITEDMREGAPR